MRLRPLFLVLLAAAVLAAGTTAFAAAISSTPAPRPSADEAGTYMVTVEGQPSALAFVAARRSGDSRREATAEAREQLDVNERAQDRLVSALRDRDLGQGIAFRIGAVYNGIGVVATPVEAARMADLPGVAAVERIVPLEPENATSVPYVNAPALWSTAGGSNTGQGIKIGIVDSGIDYVHRHFGGNALTQSYTDATSPANNPQAATPQAAAGFTLNSGGTQIYPTPKVAGGVDFAGDDYNANGSGAALVPRIDGNPMDCDPVGAGTTVGHGTHVAGTAAGLGVNTDGTTYTGSYDPPAAPSTFRVGPGVAPGAQLYALRVFGCFGATTLSSAAMNYAVDPNGDGSPADRLDVLNLSLGSAYGQPEDPQITVAQNAVTAGVAVAMSAGNSGDLVAITGSPGMAPGVISTANTTKPATFPDNAFVPSVAASSSRGPALDGRLKPDIAAPGQGIVSADARGGDTPKTLNGTSMAAPHVAGALALMRKARPSWSPVDLKARLMNSAGRDVLSGGTPQSPQRVGAGILDLQAALADDVVAFADTTDGRVGVSFGALEVTGTQTFDRTIRVTNKGTVARSYNLAFVDRSTIQGVSYSFPDGNAITVAPGASVTFPVRLTADASQMTHSHDPLLPETLSGNERSWLSEASGLVTFTPTAGGGPMRLPAYATAKPAGNVRSTVERLKPAGAVDPALSLGLTGTPVVGGATPTSYDPVVSPFELTVSSPRKDPAPAGFNGSDLRYVGIAADGTAPTSVIRFGLTSWDRFLMPFFQSTEYLVYIDTDENGTDDYLVWNSGVSSNNVGVDRFTSAVQNLSSGAASFAQPLNGINRVSRRGALATDTMVLGVTGSQLGLTAGNTSFNYRVETTTRTGGTGDVSPVRSFDVAQPGLGFGPTAFAADAPGTSIPVSYSRSRMAAHGGTGVLLLHLLGSAATRAEVIPVLEEAAPNAVPGGPYSVGEGHDLTLDGRGSSDPNGDPLSYAWDLDNDDAPDVYGANPTVPAATVAGFGMGDGPKVQTVKLTVSDAAGSSHATAQVTISNVAPSLTFTPPATVTANAPASFGLAAADASSEDTFSYELDWNADGVVDQTVGGPASHSVSHTFTTAGPVTVTATAVDDDGGRSGVQTLPVMVQAGGTATATATASPGGGGGQATPTATATRTPTATATATATATPPPAVQPSVTMVQRVLKLGRRRMGTVTFMAQPAGVVGTLSIEAPKRAGQRGLSIGTSPYTVPAGGVVTVTIQASKKTYDRLGKRPKRSARAVATFVHGGATFTHQIKVKRS